MSRAGIIQVREFEYLTASDRSSVCDRADCKVLRKDEFASLREFVLENRGDDETPLELMRLCSPRSIGEAIQLRNYVGVIELKGGLQIEVLPKIDVSSGSGLTDKDIFLRMLASLGTDVSFRALGETHLSSKRLPLFEVFVAMFLQEASLLVRAGLRSSYVERRSEESFVRGRIDFAREAKSNPAHAERLSLVFDEFCLDRPENRLIKSTLLHLRGATRSSENSRRIVRLLPAFDQVPASRNVDADLIRCVDDRSTRRYGSLIGWCRVFLKGESFTMFHGGSVATALLFPMERIFEDYVGKTLRREALRSGRLARVELQARGQWLFDDRRISLRPDILCERHDGSRVVLDTKWKRVFGRRDLSVADMYQMYAYGRRFGTAAEGLTGGPADGEPPVSKPQRVVLLYPWHEGVEPRLCIGGRHTSSDGVQVDMFFVDLANMQKSMDELLGAIEGG